MSKFIKYFFIAVGVLLCLSGGLKSQGLVIDHTSVNQFQYIPPQWIEAAKKFIIHYSHTSHGMQVMSGLEYIKKNVDPKYDIAAIYHYVSQPEPAKSFPSNSGVLRFCDTGRKPDGYWATDAGRNETRALAASGLFNFSMFGWCGELSGSRDLKAYINEYLTTLDDFEKEFPKMRFIYFTAPTDGFPAYSLLRQNNDQIREYCKKNNKILFDFADIESWDPDGNFYPQNYACSWCEEWCQKHPADCVNLPPFGDAGIPSCCPHSHGFNCYIKGKAFWYMMARLAGWDGQVQTPVEMMRLEGHIVEGGIEITWSTASESNNYGFEIQRSQNINSNFKTIGFVRGKGTSTELNEYRFVDISVGTSTYYYRLLQIDSNGNHSILNTIRIDMTLPFKVHLNQNFPNPFNNTTTISYNLPEKSDVQLIIYDLTGKKINSLIRENQTSGYYNIVWNASGLASGHYYCILTAGLIKEAINLQLIK